jgi:hypothetical protein
VDFADSYSEFRQSVLIPSSSYFRYLVQLNLFLIFSFKCSIEMALTFSLDFCIYSSFNATLIPEVGIVDMSRRFDLKCDRTGRQRAVRVY